MIKDNHNKFKELRNKYTFFVYESFVITENDKSIKVAYNFNLGDRYFFSPTLEFIKGKYLTSILTDSQLQNFAFHIGMIELISYWKAACPPNIIIKPFSLDEYQVDWWKKVYFHGLGEFFYLNNIATDGNSFVNIECSSENKLQKTNVELDKNKVLVPIGGGKDSVVTLELLKDNFKSIPLILNPRKASIETIQSAGYVSDDFIEIKRNIHPTLLQLNDLGFLNGHTPFSALLAFIGVFASFLSGSKFIALSNESSANEPTDKETGVNHQYSKSIEFERDFREYISRYINEDINYFSFLRPLNEYKIAQLFSRYPQHFTSFKSCNVGSKSDTWCGKCPKCLFTYIILSPFVHRDSLIKIFGKDLYNEASLSTHFNELIGLNEVKPFECVGTIDEVNLAVQKAIEMTNQPLPYLLDYYRSLSNNLQVENTININLDDDDHCLDNQFQEILINALNDQ